jgi:predicted esterase
MKIYMAVLLGLLNQTCKSQPEKIIASNNTRRYLVSAEAKKITTADQLKKSYGQISAFIKNGYTAYLITYNTINVDGKPVVASGALFIPDAKGPLPLLSYNHGTIFPSQERSAPSYLSGNAEISICKLFAGVGYLVVMPDYVGYGATKNLKHPYGAYNLIANTGIDMLRAVKEFCEENNINLSGKNFFSGWSEGAAVAVATVKALEEKYKGEFTPTATVANAGPYYSSGFVHHVINAQKPLTYMSTYVWVLQSYNWIYNVNKPYHYYFNEPAATDLQNGPEAYISHDPKKLFTQTFIKNYKEGRDTILHKAMIENDLWNWTPVSRIVFCHGDEDDYVPLFNSEKAYTAMKAKGADVSLNIFKGHTHSSGVLNFVQQAFTTFESAK